MRKKMATENQSFRKKMSEFMSENGVTTEQLFGELNILEKYSLEQISCALAHYCFRNGPVEDACRWQAFTGRYENIEQILP